MNASINIVNNEFETPLHTGAFKLLWFINLTFYKNIFKASLHGNTRKVDYLLLQGANPNARNIAKMTPLHYGNIIVFFKVFSSLIYVLSW